MDNKKEQEEVIHRLNPHFLFNALTALQVAAVRNPSEEYEYLKCFSSYLKGKVEKELYSDNILLSQALRQAEAYLKLQQLRFPDKISYQIHVEDDSCLIPRDLAAIYLENAVSHGIVYGRGKGTVTVTQKIIKQGWILIIEDDGTGFDLEETTVRKNSGFDRAQKIYNEQKNIACRIETEKEKGTKVTIIFR